MCGSGLRALLAPSIPQFTCKKAGRGRSDHDHTDSHPPEGRIGGPAAGLRARATGPTHSLSLSSSRSQVAGEVRVQVDALLEVAAGRKVEAAHLLLGEGAAAQRAGDCGRTGAALKSTHTCGGRGPFCSALAWF